MVSKHIHMRSKTAFLIRKKGRNYDLVYSSENGLDFNFKRAVVRAMKDEGYKLIIAEALAENKIKKG